MRGGLALPLRVRVIQPLELRRGKNRRAAGLVLLQPPPRAVLPGVYPIDAAVPDLALLGGLFVRIRRIQAQHALRQPRVCRREGSERESTCEKVTCVSLPCAHIFG